MSTPYPSPEMVAELADALRYTMVAAMDATGCNLYGDPEDYHWWRAATAALERLKRERGDGQ